MRWLNFGLVRLTTLLAIALGAAATHAQDRNASDGTVASGWVAYAGGWQPVEGAALVWSATDEGVRVELPTDVLFDFDSAALKPEAAATLALLADAIRERAPSSVRIEGHTDAKGTEAYNQALSERRAQAVAGQLSAGDGIEPERLNPVGYGETRPVAPNAAPDGTDDPQGRQRNRRVEVVLIGGSG